MADFTEALGIDVGTKRIGLARVNSIARLPEPLTTVAMSDSAVDEIKTIATNYHSDIVVVGLPRNLSSEDTKQTEYCRLFADKLRELGIPVVLQDEALTSAHAESQIASGVYRKNAMGKPVTVDEVAATIILNDFIGE